MESVIAGNHHDYIRYKEALNETTQEIQKSKLDLKNKLRKLQRKLAYHYITIVFNLSIQEGIVPLELKIANVVPIFTKGNRCKPENYKPISLKPN